MSSSDLWVRDAHSFHGRVETRPLESSALEGNALGDPATREVPVYLPPDFGAGERLPVVFLLAGLTGRGHKYFETHPWHLGVIPRYDRSLHAGECSQRAIVVAPDLFTKLGGSQYVNSSAVGAYEDHFVRELVPFIDEH
ncbi:MAG: alpha/beta hydrolase, partial [Planctomycetota bacterium]